MNLRFINWIWHVRGSLPLAPTQGSEDAFARLDPLFRQTGTSRERTGDTLTFRKKDQSAQDKMAIFDGGVLRIERGAAGSVLRYHLTSRALLFCFLAPFLFLAFAGLTVAVHEFRKPSTEAEIKADEAAKAKKKAAKERLAQMPLHPIDKALGAPGPEQPKKKDGKDKKDDSPSPTAAYVLAALFAALYVVGRILEARLVKALFSKSLSSG